MVHKLGICIPYRNRESHLNTLIPHLTKFLNKKGIPHKFYIGHQCDDKLFNRGAMKNIAAKHAFEDGCDYVAFHDVDMLPENDNCDYSYPYEYPTHIATRLSKYKYKTNYEQYFGGVVLFTKEQVEKTNGYSNDYWDWGMEDDDLFWRCIYENMVDNKIFTEYQNKKCFNFNGINSYINIPNSLKLNSILSSSHTISILCNVESQEEKYNYWLIGDDAKSFIEYPIFRNNSKDSYGIGFNNSRALCSSVRNFKNEFNYGWIKRNFNQWTWVTLSVNEDCSNIYFYCNDKLIKSTANGIIEDGYSVFSGKLKKLLSDFHIGKNSDDKTTTVADFLKGKIAEVKIWNRFFTKDEIPNLILNNTIKPYFELTDTNSELIYNNIDITLESFKILNNAIPYRRDGRFLSLPHIDEGFVNGKWAKGETTAKNEKRFFLEMQKQKLNYKEDGIAQIKYELVSKEQISDNAWMINVKL